MSRERLVRIQRVLEARQAVADRVEVELGGLTRAFLEAQRAVEQARNDWSVAMGATLASECSSADLAEVHGYATALGHRHDARVRELREADARRQACLARLAAARTEVRKLEMWRAKVLEAANREEAARERRAMDEFAARVVRTA